MSVFARFPSVAELTRGSVAAFMRFPMALLCTVTGTVALVLWIDSPHPDREFELIRLIMTTGLSLPLFIALTLLTERMRWKVPTAFAVQLLGVLLLVLHYLSLPASDALEYGPSLRLVILLVAAHALVAWLPFLGRDRIATFWEFNKSLLLRFALAALYSSVLYVGLALTLVTTDQLFDLDIPGERYAQLWFIIAGIFNTWFFLAGVPRNLENLDKDHSYPVALKVLAQYVLLSLVVVYFVILFVYELKILITWDWPKGWASMPVLCYAVGGILTLLLLHPLRKASQWVRGFIVWYFRALLPLLILLWLAIGIRVSDYGITEPRYLVIAMGVGLTLVSLYFAFSRTRDIRVIPIVITILALVSAIGPWGAFAVSERSQQARLEKMLVANELSSDGSLVTPPISMPNEHRAEMSRVTDYLLEWHGEEAFDPWLTESAITEAENDTARSTSEAMALALGFEYEYRYNYRPTNWVSVLANAPETERLTGYDMMATLDVGSIENIAVHKRFDGAQYSCWVDLPTGGREMMIQIGSENDPDTLVFPLAERVNMIAQCSVDSRVMIEQATFDVESERFRVRLRILNANGELTGKSLLLHHVNCLLLIGRK
ncbi:DUF4153 domain-containing protein [candidate division GN15 bacterium]|nr:DUF4153 domain-containing protein [candidate division GN15 bacterium]